MERHKPHIGIIPALRQRFEGHLTNGMSISPSSQPDQIEERALSAIEEPDLLSVFSPTQAAARVVEARRQGQAWSHLPPSIFM